MMGCKMMPIVFPAFSPLALTIDSCKQLPQPASAPAAIWLSPSKFVIAMFSAEVRGPSPIFFVAPDVTRFGQEIGSIILVVVVVIVVIADLQQKTAGPKIELQCRP